MAISGVNGQENPRKYRSASSLVGWSYIVHAAKTGYPYCLDPKKFPLNRNLVTVMILSAALRQKRNKSVVVDIWWYWFLLMYVNLSLIDLPSLPK